MIRKEINTMIYYPHFKRVSVDLMRMQHSII